MQHRRILTTLAITGLLAGLAAVGFFTRATWLPWIFGPEKPADDKHAPALAANDKVKLSAQAQSNLGLTSKKLLATTYWRTLQIPGIIVDRPGHSDRGVVAPVTAVVTKVHALPGDTVRYGQQLFTVRLLSEALYFTQSELFKATLDLQFAQKEKKRLTALAEAGGVAEARLLDLENQLRRLTTATRAYRQELQSRGLTPEQIDRAAEGNPVTEIQVLAPSAGPGSGLGAGAPIQPLPGKSKAPPIAFEVEQLKIELGQQVQAGQTMAVLSNHQSLYIEGHSFRREAPFLERAAQQGWPVQVEFAEDGGKKKDDKKDDKKTDDQSWPPLRQTFAIRHLANTVDQTSRTLNFYVPLENQARSYDKDKKTFLVWRFRTGQRVRLRVPVEELKGDPVEGKPGEFTEVLVLPTAAVVREGPEAYVFRQNGDLFRRIPVHVLYEDRTNVVLANDGSIRLKLDYVAQTAAASLNRMLKAQTAAGGLPPGAHFHADGSLHIPGQ